MAGEMRPGDWMCDMCGHHNFAKREACKKCGASKAEAGLGGPSSGPIRSGPSRANRDGPYNAFGARPPPTTVDEEPRQPRASRRQRGGAKEKDGDWVCPECGNHNFASRIHCNRCNYVRDGMKDGDWICRSCKHHNYARNKSCNKCGAERVPEPERTQEQPESASKAGKSGKTERSRPGPSVAPSMAPHLAAQAMAQPMPMPMPSHYGHMMAPPPPGDPMMHAMMWQQHAAYMAGIAASGAPYPGGDGGRGGRGGGGQHQEKKKPKGWQEGDWICKKCDNHNFAKRTSCNKCGALRPRYKPGDWTCPKCNAHNFRSRNECHKCSAPRPEDLMEEGLPEGEEEAPVEDEAGVEHDEMGLDEELL